ncbi:MAG: hypothetical protein PHF61_09865 [Bacteroidales bacterium]|nr:hypothetical protein [Bacteroidales bacterium]
MMEVALRHELNKITDIANKIYPTNAPEGATGPYLVYARINTDKVKTLEGYTNKQALSYMFSIMAAKYSDMISVRDKVEDALLAFPGTSIGDKTKIYIEDLDINNIDEQYEHELGVNRGIIDFTIYY